MVGTVGNTGNAKTTPPHLHFGIYGFRRSINPYYYLKPTKSIIKSLSPDKSHVGNWMIANESILRGSIFLEQHERIKILAYTDKNYRIKDIRGNRITNQNSLIRIE